MDANSHESSTEEITRYSGDITDDSLQLDPACDYSRPFA